MYGRCSGCGDCEIAGVRNDSTPHLEAGEVIPQGYVCIERCDACQRYESDMAAALAWHPDAKELPVSKTAIAPAVRYKPQGSNA